MKNLIKISTVLILSLLITNLSAQNFSKLSSSLKDGNVKEIASQLDEKVEVSILNDESYTKKDAEILLASFFNKNSLSGFKAIHRGSTIGDAYYQIGELQTETEVYRTYVYSKEINGQYLIKEFRIEKQ